MYRQALPVAICNLHLPLPPSYIWLESSADLVTMVPLTGWGGAIGELHDTATSAGTADRQDAWSACTPCSSNPTNQRRESREVGG